MGSHKNMPKAVLHSLRILLKTIWKMKFLTLRMSQVLLSICNHTTHYNFILFHVGIKYFITLMTLWEKKKSCWEWKAEASDKILDKCKNSAHVDNSGNIQVYKILFIKYQCGWQLTVMLQKVNWMFITKWVPLQASLSKSNCSQFSISHFGAKRFRWC